MRARGMMRWIRLGSEWRREELRTNLWLVPIIEVIAGASLFIVTLALDRAVYRKAFGLPSWVISGGADAARQILTTLAAAVITVVGVVFSVVIVALTLASTQFGPRMLRNFVRDRGTQVTLGTFVATFVYAILALVSIGPGSHGDFVPHISITVSLGLVVADMALLIYFIHHITRSIQLPHVIASIAKDLSKAIATQGGGRPGAGDTEGGPRGGLSPAELTARMAAEGGVVLAPSSGYLQFVHHRTLMRIVSETNAVISLRYRPGHFLVEGQPLATVWPPEAAPRVARDLERTHITGPYRTLTQDVSFGIDQLVEIAIRALSPAVNDTFTALTCIDWLGDSLSKVAGQWHPSRLHRDRTGQIRVITADPGYDRLVQRAFEKIRQASHGMPAVMIRQLDVLAKTMEQTATVRHRRVLLEQAEMIQRANSESVTDELDRADVRRRYDTVLAAYDQVARDHGQAADRAATEPG